MAKCNSNCKCRKHISRKHSPETRARISASLRGNKNALGHKRTLEMRAHMRKAKAGFNHTQETRAKLSAIVTGRKATAETREKIRNRQRQHATKRLPNCRCVVHRKDFTVSKLSGLMIDTFLKDFPETIPEKEFGRCRVDAYLPPPYHLAFEADGDYWHRVTEDTRPGYYHRRDAYLLHKFNLPVVRLTEAEIRAAANV